MTQVPSSTVMRHPLASKRYILLFRQDGEESMEVFELLSRYEAVGPIGQGTYGYVCSARDGQLSERFELDPPDEYESGELTEEEKTDFYDGCTLVAVKKLKQLFEDNQPRMWLCATREIQLMMSFNHDNVMSASDFFIPLGGVESMNYDSILHLMQSFDSVYVVMKKMDYTLREVLDSVVLYPRDIAEARAAAGLVDDEDKMYSNGNCGGGGACPACQATDEDTATGSPHACSSPEDGTHHDSSGSASFHRTHMSRESSGALDRSVIQSEAVASILGPLKRSPATTAATATTVDLTEESEDRYNPLLGGGGPAAEKKPATETAISTAATTKSTTTKAAGATSTTTTTTTVTATNNVTTTENAAAAASSLPTAFTAAVAAAEDALDLEIARQLSLSCHGSPNGACPSDVFGVGVSSSPPMTDTSLHRSNAGGAVPTTPNTNPNGEGAATSTPWRSPQQARCQPSAGEEPEDTGTHPRNNGLPSKSPTQSQQQQQQQRLSQGEEGVNGQTGPSSSTSPQSQENMNESDATANQNHSDNAEGEEQPLRDPRTQMLLHPLQRDYRKFILYQILRGVGYLHRCPVIHRDLKPENIMLDRSYNTCITDFGQGRDVGVFTSTSSATNRANRMGDGGGGDRFGNASAAESSVLGGETIMAEYVQTVLDNTTQWYAAPETLTLAVASTGVGFIDHETFHGVDVWSVGCIAAEMLTGRPLFCTMSMGGIGQLISIIELLGEPRPDAVNYICEFRDKRNRDVFTAVIQRIIDKFKGRQSILKEMLRSPYGDEDEDEVELIARCLAWDPRERMTIQEALESPFFVKEGYTPVIDLEDTAKRVPSVRPEDISEPVSGRAFLWELFVQRHPEVGELWRTLVRKHDEEEERGRSRTAVVETEGETK